MSTERVRLGIVVGNRGFFPDHLAKTAVRKSSRYFKQPEQANCARPRRLKTGAVETYAESKKCAELFKEARGRD